MYGMWVQGLPKVYGLRPKMTLWGGWILIMTHANIGRILVGSILMVVGTFRDKNRFRQAVC